jgi:hypothetical protein
MCVGKTIVFCTRALNLNGCSTDLLEGAAPRTVDWLELLSCPLPTILAIVITLAGPAELTRRTPDAVYHNGR